MSPLPSLILKLGKEAGFDSIGITSLHKNQAGADLFEQWIQKGFHGEMEYLKKGIEKRKDPSLILPNASSILLVTESDQAKEPTASNRSPFISRYVWGTDYHERLGEKLDHWVNLLKEHFPDATFRRYVDTGPIQEKYWAQLSGMGWIGKHTNLIHPQKGSYFFIGSILTDLILPSNAPSTDHCGKCNSCIEICPTQAIVAPYLLDARRCISYLTIELKGPIPRELRKGIGQHLFGCDDCQIVCPWNRRANLPVEEIRNSDLQELINYLSLTPEAFKKQFQGSPILRAKRKGFLRNVCIVLGNLKNSLAIPALCQALEDPEELVRGHAAWALGEMGGEKAIQTLQKKIETENINWVREELFLALGQYFP